MFEIVTAEIFARAIIAAAISYGDDPIDSCTALVGSNYRRALAPAIYGLHEAIGGDRSRYLQIVGTRPDGARVAKSRGGDRFRRAQEAAREAAAYHLRTQEMKARAQPCAEPAGEMPGNPVFQAPPISISVGADVVAFDVEPAPRANDDCKIAGALQQAIGGKVSITRAPSPAPSRPATKPAAKPARAMPRGAKLVNLGEGVQRIVTQPVPESVARHAKQQLDRGADLDFVADLFGFEPADLKVAVDSLNRGEPWEGGGFWQPERTRGKA